MSKETHFNYDRLELNLRGEWEMTGKARLTEENADVLNLDHKRTKVKYVQAEEEEEEVNILVSWETIDNVEVPTLGEGITIAKMKIGDLKENFPQIAETNPKNVTEFRNQVLATYPDLK